MKITYDGRVMYNGPMQNPNDLYPDLTGYTVEYTDMEAHSIVRIEIEREAGDQQSLLGTTSDTIGLLFYEVAKLAIALKDQNSLAAIRDAATPLADMMAPVIARVEAGDTLLTHLIKGEANVIEEMEQRATQVATVLQSVQSA